ncbi:MAG: cytochrome c peroxidase [bacterium]
MSKLTKLVIYKISIILGMFILSACSGGSDGSSSTSSVTPNNAPTVSRANSDQSGQVGYDFTYDATQSGNTFVDADGDALTYTISYAPDNGDYSDNNGIITGIPSVLEDVTVTITANDGLGGTASNNFLILVSVDQNAILAEFSGNIDLENLESYANPTIPNYITKLNDGGNPVTDAGATLGRVLFYDTRLSIDDTVSCSSCHLQAHAFSDLDVVSEGVDSGVTIRHAMRLINTQYADETHFFWDERALSQEDQETQPLADHNEHGFSGQSGRPDFSDLIVKMEALEYYEELFRFAFLSPEITEDKIGIALAQFVKSIHSFDSKYDQGRAQVNNDNQDFPNFTADENAGKTLFLTAPNNGGAGCQGCHRAPEFDIDPNSDSNGIVLVANNPNQTDFTNTRAPTLRDLVAPDTTLNGQIMHNGSLLSLRDVIDHYDQITVPAGVNAGDFRAALDNRLMPGGNTQRLNLTETEKAQLEDFLRTLTGSNVYTDPKWSSPF